MNAIASSVMSDCCAPKNEATAPPVSCPSCHSVGQAVARETVGAMATLSVPATSLCHEHYRYCSTPGCAVVYYSGDTVVLQQSDVRVPVNAKDAGPDVPLCYCFGHTRRTIAEEIAATGQSTAFAAITREVKAGHCACEVKNASGRCCLGEVRAYEKRAAQSHAIDAPAPTASAR
ncbi:MAG: hypothetical protein HY271_02040 [Deltaproteobacteria bacterium]|nr:hypothetical protein [Deltaproteobacteria bacterium]